jgi:DNA-directed RNA polymerase sigma subunit (sigma70/sigma32)
MVEANLRLVVAIAKVAALDAMNRLNELELAA